MFFALLNLDGSKLGALCFRLIHAVCFGQSSVNNREWFLFEYSELFGDSRQPSTSKRNFFRTGG
jgi:hypothetical protein